VQPTSISRLPPIASKATGALDNSTTSDLPASQPEVPVSESAMLTGCEFQRLTSSEAEAKDCQQSLAKKRRKYEAQHVIHRCYETEDGRTLAPASTVRCHDLGVEGISFCWPACP